MEFQKLKSEIKEIVEIVKECPEALQEKCFEVLLMELLNSTSKHEHKQNIKTNKEILEETKSEFNIKESPNRKNEDGNDVGDTSEEIAMRDLHAKTRRFIETQNITIEDLNKIYYKSEGKILPLYDGIGTNRISESQVRLSLLTAFENSFNSGEFEFSGEVVRERCKQLKCYDAPNFTKNFKNNSSLFDGFDQYDKDSMIKLSPSGKIELGNILKELSK